MAPVGCSSWTSLWTEIDSRAPRSPAGTVTSAGLLGRRRLRPDSRLVPQHLGHRGAIEVARITKASTHNACARQQRIAEVRPPEIRSHRPRVAEVGASQERAVWWIAACVAPLTRAAAAAACSGFPLPLPALAARRRARPARPESKCSQPSGVQPGRGLRETEARPFVRVIELSLFRVPRFVTKAMVGSRWWLVRPAAPRARPY